MSEPTPDSMLSELVDKMLGGDRRALSRLLSSLESDPALVPAVMKALHPHTGSAYCVAFTGPPGAGKSTLIDRLIPVLKGAANGIAVLAVDPTSPFSSGAVLGDRVRMKRHFLDQNVYIRSFATRGARGGLARVARAAVRLLDAFGFEFVVVESVGVGQTELDAADIADTVVVTLVPEAGDAVQAMKAGLLEIADVVVVNKADRKGADRVAEAVMSEVGAKAPDAWWTPPVLLTQAHRGQGVDALHQAVVDHRRASEETSNLQRRRAERRKIEFAQVLKESVEAKIAELRLHERTYGDLLARVESGEIDPYSAAAEALRSDETLSRLNEQSRQP